MQEANTVERKLVRQPDGGLVLVVPPLPLDVIAMRGYILGHFIMFSGFALLGPHFGQWDPHVRIGTALVGLLAGYMHGIAAIHRPRRATRFVFQPNGAVLITTVKGRALYSTTIPNSGVELQRSLRRGPGRFEWKWALASVALDLCEEDFEALRKCGLRLQSVEPAALQRTFTPEERREWWVWSVFWSASWWCVALRSIFSDG